MLASAFGSPTADMTKPAAVLRGTFHMRMISAVVQSMIFGNSASLNSASSCCLAVGSGLARNSLVGKVPSIAVLLTVQVFSRGYRWKPLGVVWPEIHVLVYPDDSFGSALQKRCNR